MKAPSTSSLTSPRAGMSVREQQILLPDYVIEARTSLDDLASAYVPWSNTPLFASPRAGVRYPFQSWPEADLRRLDRDWLQRSRLLSGDCGGAVPALAAHAPGGPSRDAN